MASNHMDALNNLSFRSHNATTIKLLVVGVLIFVCLVPSLFVFILLSERTNRQEEAKKEITDKWGSNQLIIGPILSLPYHKSSVDPQGFIRESSGVISVLPKKLNHNVSILVL